MTMAMINASAMASTSRMGVAITLGESSTWVMINP